MEESKLHRIINRTVALRQQKKTKLYGSAQILIKSYRKLLLNILNDEKESSFYCDRFL